MAVELRPNELAISEVALSVMNTWQWVWYDPDGVPHSRSLTLSEAVNRLAFEGIVSPKDALLSMFVQGQLQATADFRWSKYQRGETFYVEEGMAVIPVAKWEALRAALKDQRDRWLEFEMDGDSVELPKLGFESLPAVEWQPQYDRFSYALREPEMPPHDPRYFEEVYDAHSITIFPLALPGPDDGLVGSADQVWTSSFPRDDSNGDQRRGRRPKYDWPAASVAVFGMIHRGDLKPESQADVERALILHLTQGDSSPSESTVRPFAKLIWEEQAKA